MRTVNSVSARLTGLRALSVSLSLFPNPQSSKNEHTGPCKPVLFVCLVVCLFYGYQRFKLKSSCLHNKTLLSTKLPLHPSLKDLGLYFYKDVWGEFLLHPFFFLSWIRSYSFLGCTYLTSIHWCSCVWTTFIPSLCTWLSPISLSSMTSPSARALIIYIST